MSWFCKFGGPTTSGSANSQNHRSRVAGHALTDQRTSSVVYRATVHVSNSDSVDDMHSIGLTERTFKERYTSHMLNFKLERYAGATELSQYVWTSRRTARSTRLKYEVLRMAPAYSSTSKRCQLCTTEKLLIAIASRKTLLNKRSELRRFAAVSMNFQNLYDFAQIR